MDLTTLIFIAVASIFFIIILSAFLVIIDHKAADEAEKRDDLWSIRGMRDSHPVWAWVVSAALIGMCAMLIVGIVVRLGFEHGHEASAHTPKPVQKAAKEGRHDGSEEGSLLKKIKKDEVMGIRKHFHHTLKEDPTTKGKQTVCFYCHGSFPHKRQRMIRTLLNMHTQFLGCLTCHLEGVEQEDIALRWYNISGIKPSGRPFGLGYDPLTGSIEETEDYYSKITAFTKGEGEERLMEIPEDDPSAQEFIRMRSELGPEEQTKIKNIFHKGVGAKGRFCTKCHRAKDSYIPFKELGFSDTRIADLTGLNIVSITEKYKEFFIPTIYRDVTTPKVREEKLGPEEPPVEIPAEKLKDPRFWWMEKFKKSAE